MTVRNAPEDGAHSDSGLPRVSAAPICGSCSDPQRASSCRSPEPDWQVALLCLLCLLCPLGPALSSLWGSLPPGAHVAAAAADQACISSLGPGHHSRRQGQLRYVSSRSVGRSFSMRGAARVVAACSGDLLCLAAGGGPGNRCLSCPACCPAALERDRARRCLGV
jgi:hypothetical protein